jgi:hypothetical protein
MKTTLLIATLAASLVTLAPAAYAKGCVKGALVGGAAGHVAVHHGLLGAAAGCLIGRHHAAKKEQERVATQHAATQHASR